MINKANDTHSKSKDKGQKLKTVTNFKFFEQFSHVKAQIKRFSQGLHKPSMNT